MGDTGRSSNKFKRIDRFSDASSDNGTDPDEYIRVTFCYNYLVNIQIY